MAIRSSLELVAVARTTGSVNDGDSRKRRGYHPRILGIVPANIRPASVHLSKHPPDTHLPGKDHEVILMDDRDHAGFEDVGCRTAANAGSSPAILLHACCWLLLLACRRRRVTVRSFADQTLRPADRIKQLCRPYSRSTLRFRVIATIREAYSVPERATGDCTPTKVPYLLW